MDKMDDNVNNEYFDFNFSKILHSMEKTRSLTNRFNRLSTSKYNISGVVDKDDKKDVDYDDDDGDDYDCDTFLDDTCHRLLSIDTIPYFCVSLLKQIVIDQEYDTEALDIDVKLFVSDGISNISQEIENNHLMTELINIFYSVKGTIFILFCFVFILLSSELDLI